MTVLPTICSTVRRWTLSCGLTSQSRSGRVLPSSFSYSEKNSVKPGHTLRLAPWSIVRGLCTGGPLSPWGFVQVAPLTSLSAVVSGHRQCHCDSLLLVTPLAGVHPFETSPNTRAGASLGQTSCCCCFQRGHGRTVSMLTKSGLRRALDHKELFVVEGSENWRSTPGQPGGARKMA